MDVDDLRQRVDLVMARHGLVHLRVRVGTVELVPSPLVVELGLGGGDALPSDYSPAESVYRYRVFVPHTTLVAAGLGRAALAVGTRWWLGLPWQPVVVTGEVVEGPVGYEVELRRLGRDEV